MTQTTPEVTILERLAVRRELGPLAQEEYDRVCGAAKIEHDRVCKSARVEYDRVRIAAGVEHRRVLDVVWEEFERLSKPAKD